MELIIRLEPHEALLLAERVPNEACHFEDGEALGRKYLLKLFSAMDELTTDDGIKPEGFVDISISEEEMWLTKSCISVFEKVDGKAVGLKLRRKVHALILRFNSDPELPYGEVSEEPVYELLVEEEVITDDDPRPDKDNSTDGTKDGPVSEASS